MSSALRAAAPEEHRSLAGQRVLVMGLGSFGGGAGAARYLASLGAEVVVTDQRSADGLGASLAELADLELEYALAGHRSEDFERAALVVVNPAVRPDHPLLRDARESGARITSEIELLLEAVRGRVVAITGTQGKSSTTHALHSLLSLCGRCVHAGGNLGGSLLPALPRIGSEDLVVLELSSYQLESLSGRAAAARAEAVSIVNILQDHLERHGTAEAYAAAKRRILELVRPSGVAVLPAEDERMRGWSTAGRKLFFSTEDGAAELHIRDGCFRLDGEVLGRVADLALPGDFQRANALVALGLARVLGVSAGELADALPHVRGLEHRLQELGTFRGKRVIDNAVSTTPDSTVSALRALPPGTVLVLGGKQKRLPLEELCAVARERVARAIAFGEAGPTLAAALEEHDVPVETVRSVEQAVERALAGGAAGETVLFSPACASFDSYANFQERARAFRRALELER